MTIAQVIAGTKAKLTGHKNEQMICDWLNQSRGGSHVVDGRSQTKRDIINEEESVYYGLKSVTSNHTHCHISVVHKWCEHFNITCLLYTSPSPRDRTRSRMPSSA